MSHTVAKGTQKERNICWKTHCFHSTDFQLEPFLTTSVITSNMRTKAMYILSIFDSRWVA